MPPEEQMRKQLPLQYTRQSSLRGAATTQSGSCGASQETPTVAEEEVEGD